LNTRIHHRCSRHSLARANRWQWLLVLMLCVVPCRAISGSLVVDMADVKGRLSIEPYTLYLQDAQQNFSAQEILQGELDAAFLGNGGGAFNFGLSEATYWLVFELSDNLASADTSATRLLQVNYPPLDNLKLHYLDDRGAVTTFATGDSLPFAQRPLLHNAYLFPITLSAGETKRFVLEVRSEGSIRIPMVLWESDAFTTHNENSLLLYGIYFGIIGLMLLYNLILYLFIRDTSYLHYLFYISSLTLFQSSFNGFAFQHLWPDHPELNNPALILSLFAMLMSGCLITRTVLDTGTTLPVLHRILTGLVLFFFAMLFFSNTLPYHAALNIGIWVGVVSVILIVVSAATNAWRGIRTARFFLLAWFSALVGGIVLGCVSAGLLPVNSFTANAFILGTAIEVTLLSLSLADRINRIERSKTLAEQQAKQALLEVNRTLMESNRIKDEFLNTISHEMRTPMHGVLSSVQHIRSEDDDNRRQLFIDSAERSAQQMMMLIDSVLNYTELHSSGFRLERDPFRLSRLVESLDQLFRAQAQASGLDFSIDVDSDVPDLVIGDFRRTQQILINLLSNAVKFTQQGFVKLLVKVVTIDNRIYHTRLLFQVSDSGVGIPAGMEEVVFERFRQLQGGFNRGFGGLGIGLATSREICRLMGAELTYTSTPQHGTTFNFITEFPFSPRSSATRKAEPPVYDWKKILHDRLCLIVEDNVVNQMVLKATLNKLGLRTLVASNGRDALELMAMHPVDIVLMDCQMPLMDGFEATRAIRALTTHKAMVPIIAITANAMSKDRERCVSAGMNDYMSKPVDMHELKEKLLKWLPLKPATPLPERSEDNVVPLDSKRDRQN
jgi:signal transduction histidine kinase/ActR/RegA family two-component response regulator